MTVNGGSGNSTTPQTTQNRCYQRDSDACSTTDDGAGSGFYVGDDYLDSLAIPGITEEEADRFLNALRGES